MKIYLPHSFKKVGVAIAPVGFALWLLMQLGVVAKVLAILFGEPVSHHVASIYQVVNTTIAIIGFCGFMVGMYFISFSKEKIEDEMINKIRLDSFQFAAFVQIVFVIGGFLSMLMFGSPREGWLMLFLISALLLFWLSYMLKFNYSIKVSIGNEE